MFIKENSLSKKVWLYLALFSVSILAFLWLFQITFLNIFYEFSKTNQMSSVADMVEKNYTDPTNLDRMAFNNEVCIEITSGTKLLYSTSQYSKGCMLQDTNTSTYKNDFINSDSKRKTYKLINEKFDNEALIYALKLEDNMFAFVSTSLVPLETTTNILAQQFIYVSIGVLILSFIIALYISRYISNPIVNLNKRAAKMAEGDYTPNFDVNNDIAEIDDLGNTLNYACVELSKTEELRRELMANVSHDLKTPLTMIKAYAEMARDLNCDNKKKREQNLDVIIEEADRLNILVNDILDLSKMQSNVVDLEYCEFNLTKLVKTIIKRYSYLKKDGIKFKLECNKDFIVKADIKRIEQVLYNLINNAINFIGEDKLVLISLIDNDNTVRVEVTDHGNGIKNSELKLIWNKYYKVDKKYRRNNVGSGIGLSIVKSTLEKHKVLYGVDSKLGEGTTFYFELNKK